MSTNNFNGNVDLASFFNNLDSSSSYNKTTRKYVVVNPNAGVITIQFIRPTKDIYKPRYYVKCSVKDEYSGKRNSICYDPKDTTNPLTLMVDRFKKLRINANSKNPGVSVPSKAIMQNHPDLVNLVLGTGEVDDTGFKNIGFCGTEYFVANIVMIDNSGNPITSGVFSRGSKEVPGDHGKFNVHNLGISWYVLYQAFKKRNIDLYKDFNIIYNYAITVKVNNPNFNDPNWFSNNSILDILALNNAINTNGLEEFDIEKVIKYTSYDTIANKLGSIFKKIDESDLCTNFNNLLKEKVIAEHNLSSNTNNSNNNVVANNNFNNNSNISNSNFNNSNNSNSVFNDNSTNTFSNNNFNPNMNMDNNSISSNQLINQALNNGYVPNSNSNFNNSNFNTNNMNNSNFNIPNTSTNNFNNNSVFANNSNNSCQQSQQQVQNLQIQNNSNISNNNIGNAMQQQSNQQQVVPPQPTQSQQAVSNNNVSNNANQISNNQNNNSTINSVSFDDLFN